MLKLLITGALIYFVYRFFIAQPAIGDSMSDNHARQDHNQQQQQQQQQQQSTHDDEYIDYEEVD